MTKKIWAIIAVIVVILIIVAVSGGNDQKGPIKIGISTVLTGDFAAAGENMVNATRSAVDDINSSGGINGRQLELIIQDAGWDSKTGLAAAQKLINIDEVRYIIGGTSSNGTLAAAPLVNEENVIYMTPVTGGSNIDKAGEYVFRIANSDLLAGRDLAKAAFGLGYKKVATVTEVTEYTLDIKKTFEQTLASLGGEVVSSEEFQPGTTDFRTIVAKVKASQPQAILILSQTGVGGGHFMKQSKDLGVTVPFFSDFTFVTNENAKKIIGSFEGLYFADPAYNENTSKEFLDRYQQTYGIPSLIPFHALSSYDSVMMMAEALREVGDDSKKVHDWLLKNVKAWKGLMGEYSLDKNGNSDLGFVIKMVRDGKFVTIP